MALALNNLQRLICHKNQTTDQPKQSDGEAPAMELCGMQITPSLPSLPGLLWLGVVTHEWVLSIGQIELFDI